MAPIPWISGSRRPTTSLRSIQRFRPTPVHVDFTAHYNGSHQPLGLYTHLIQLATDYPGATASNSTINAINQLLDWAQEQQNRSGSSRTSKYLAWVQNPVPISQFNAVKALQCERTKVCNGVPGDEARLLAECPFSDLPFFACYGCPSSPPVQSDPEQDSTQQTGPRSA
uniref:Uncharacterized protein n=1 Tax=Mycena chlorophos TaxID=658473 RepID=A0ABQ0LDN8_MYCCL|nr:predicted protein [Mycena chlorophos]